LLTAAERVIARLGFGGASLDLIAMEARFSKGAVYSNFASKEVFLGLLRQYMERDLSELERLVTLEPKALKLAVTEWLETMHADSDCPLRVAELQLHARRSQDFAKQYYALQERQTQTLASLIASIDPCAGP
jgi:AcrR family transcriptional regulator